MCLALKRASLIFAGQKLFRMKFTTDELVEALRAKMTANGKSISVSDRTIKANVERIYKRLDKAGNEDELNAVVEEYLPDFEEINGNIRKDNSDFIKEWTRANAPKQKTEPEEEQKKQGNATTVDDRLDALMKEIQTLKADAATARDKAEREAKVSSIRKSLTEQGIKDEKWLSSYMKKLNVTKDSNVETEITDALELYNISHAGKQSSNITPNNSGGGTVKDETDYSDVKRIVNRRRGVTEAIKK